MTTHEITPKEAAEEYVASRHEVTESTRDNHRVRLRWFCEWCQSENISTLDELTGYHLQHYTNFRVNEGSCNLVTIEQHIHTLRLFLRWAEKAELASEGISQKVVIPNISSTEKARDEAISHERAMQIQEYLAEFHFASLKHITFALLYHTGMRRSGLHSLDVDDWHPGERYVSLRHRPEQGTRLKLGEDGERNVSIVDDELADALNAYIAHQRDDVEDEYGRKPLLTSKHGRLHYQSITKQMYTVTRPCFYSDECTVGREISECESANDYQQYSKCPDCVSAHPARRSAITHALREGVPKEIVSGRMSVSGEVLDLHYDARTIEERRENRREHLDGI